MQVTDTEKITAFKRIVDALIRECQQHMADEPLDSYWMDRLTGLKDARQLWIDTIGTW